jgi:rare lipoprotein A
MHLLLLAALVSLLALSGCGYVPMYGAQGIHSEAPGAADGKRLQAGTEQMSRPRVAYPRGQGFVDPKLQPYSINGKTYWPIQSGLGYNEVGTASWYGIDFHGKKTATGEIYDMFGVSAAHKTLPLGTKVRVTNMENGRAIELTVNDRGPFVDGRIIDLSYASARLLGMADNGVAKVRVEGIQENPALAAAGARPGALAAADAPARRSKSKIIERNIVERTIVEEPARDQPRAKRQAAKTSAAAGPEQAPRAVLSADNGRYAVQVGAFSQDDNARRVQQKLVQSGYGGARITRVVRGGRELMAVQAAAFEEREKAEEALRILRTDFPASFISTGA